MREGKGEERGNGGERKRDDGWEGQEGTGVIDMETGQKRIGTFQLYIW